MTFPTNTSPYGSNPIGAPQQRMQQLQKGNIFSSLFGRPESNYQQPTLGAEQQQNYSQLLGAAQAPGAGGAFGESADYYRDLLSNDSQTANAMFAPELRRFNEDIIPQLGEQFSGYGGLGSSGFRNSAVRSSTDLSERLGAIRAQLRQQGAAGLSNIGQMGLGSYNENIHRPETHGLVGNFAEGAGKALGAYATGKIPGIG
jgi:hypothetical protein